MVQTAQIWYSDWVYVVKGNDKVKTQNLSIFDHRHDVIVEYRGQIGPKFISRGKIRYPVTTFSGAWFYCFLCWHGVNE